MSTEDLKKMSPEDLVSDREQQILIYASDGLSAKEIAKVMKLSYRTVEKYSNSLKKKLSAKNMTHAVKKAFEKNIIPIEKMNCD